MESVMIIFNTEDLALMIRNEASWKIHVDVAPRPGRPRRR